MSINEGPQATYPIYVLTDELTFYRLEDPLELQGCTWQHCDREHHDIWDSEGSHFTLDWEPRYGGFLVFDKLHDAHGFSAAADRSIAWMNARPTAPETESTPRGWLRLLAAVVNLLETLVARIPVPTSPSHQVVDPDELRALAQAMRNRGVAADQAPEGGHGASELQET